MPKEVEKEALTAPVEPRPEEEMGKARFIQGEQVVDAEGKVIEGLSVKDGAIVGKEKAAEKAPE